MTGLPDETPDGLPRAYTPAQVADALGYSEWWVRQQARHHRVPHLRGGAGAVRFTAEQARALVILATIQAEQQAPEPVGLLSSRSRARSRR